MEVCKVEKGGVRRRCKNTNVDVTPPTKEKTAQKDRITPQPRGVMN